MTPDEINKLVATHVMGLDVSNPFKEIPDYSRDPAAAWEVVEQFAVGYVQIDNGWREVNGERVGGWTCRIVAPGEVGEATAPTMEMAVALAALKAKGVEVA